MPKVVIKGQEPEPKIEYHLSQGMSCVWLNAVGVDGERWVVASLPEDGTMLLSAGIPGKSGLKVDGSGRIVISNIDSEGSQSWP